jgi:hypothetical protein
MDKKKTKTDRTKSEAEKRLIEVSRKLGIAIPASLFLLTTANAAIVPEAMNEHPNSKTEIQKTLSNEVIEQLFGYAKKGVELASASDCNGIHGDSYVDKDDPNVTREDGTHGNIHTAQHGDSCRY